MTSIFCAASSHPSTAASQQTAPRRLALIDFIMSKDCPVSPSLTDGDKASLLRIKQDATNQPEGQSAP
jgi:hypothetical protein